MVYDPSNIAQNWNYYQSTNTGDNLKGGLIGNGTIGGFVNCAPSEREKFCPRDGVMFGERDNYCSRCGRPVGYLSYQGYQGFPSPWYPPYTTTWGSQALQSTANQEYNESK